VQGGFYLQASVVVSLLASSSAPTPPHPVYQAEWGFSPVTVTVVFGVYALAILAVLLAARVVQGLATGAGVSALGAGMLDLDKASRATRPAIGEHTAREAPLWATRALGEVPADPAGRAGWERNAAQLGAYREMFGWDHPGEAIGPEPALTFPEARAEWHAAFAVMTRVEGIDVRHLTNGQLLARRRAYQAETSWAPVHVAEELRAARRQEQHSKIEATRHTYEATAAARRGKHD